MHLQAKGIHFFVHFEADSDHWKIVVRKHRYTQVGAAAAAAAGTLPGAESILVPRQPEDTGALPAYNLRLVLELLEICARSAQLEASSAAPDSIIHAIVGPPHRAPA